uniref:SLC26A/SulP transporter domain-containing protein n=1 Tax=Corethron hystrix TaxID=216773 RepID=A0A7S1BZH2_9STRA
MYYRPFPSVTSLSSECEAGDDSSSSSADECEGSIGRRPTRRQRSLSLGTDSFPRFRTNDGGGAAEIPLDVEDGLCLSVSPITPSTADLVIRGEGDLVTRAKASTEGPAETSPLLHHPASALVSLHHPAPPLVSPKFPAHLPTPEKYKVHRRMSSIISSVCKPLLYGGVNCVMCIPCLYGYAAIIFRHPAYAGSVTALTKLALLSSMVHQLSFSFCSTLPFAIGQVQDAGLLFLSAMASDIADHVSSMTLEGTDPTPAIISTAVVLLGLATAALGAALMAAGRLRLADAVSYLPLPVVGGYLAFIGYFCLQAGVGLCASEDMVTVSDWGKVVNVRDVGLVLPGLIGGVVMTLSARLMPDALPAVMVRYRPRFI